MPLNIPAELIVEKNKLYPGESGHVVGFPLPAQLNALMIAQTSDSPSVGTFLELLETQLLNGQTLRIANNNEDVSWGGYTWTRFRFEGGDQSDGDDGESKSVTVRVSNLAGTVQSEIETASNCLIGDMAIYRLIHTKHPDRAPAIVGHFDIMEAEAGDEWITFELGVENFYLNAFPRNTYRRNVCRYQPHQTDVCGYAAGSSCDRSLATCITLGRAAVFGGQPGIPGGVWIV